MKNRIIIFVLSVFVLISVLPFSAFAEETSQEVIANPDYLEYRISNNAVTITGYESSESGKLIIPAELDGCPVTAIAKDAFRYCANLTEIVLPESIVTIGEYAFRRCTSLKSVNIPESVTEIGKYAFSQCENLVSVTIPEGVTVINEYLFQKCYALESVTLGRKVEILCDSAFIECTALKSIVIPKTITTIQYSVFNGCTSLVVVYMESDSLPQECHESWLYGTTAGIEFGYIYPEDIVPESSVPESESPESQLLQESAVESAGEYIANSGLTTTSVKGILGTFVSLLLVIGMIVDRKKR